MSLNLNKFSISIVSAIILFSSIDSHSVMLENWRFPFYKLAADMDLVRSSPSGMFWDDIDGAPIFSPGLWPDSSRYNANHWTVEPSFRGGSVAEMGDAESYYHLDLLNDIKYKNLTVRQTLDVDKRYENDPLYPAHREREARGRIEEAYLQLDFKHGFMRLGRVARNWGPFSDRSLMVSSNPYTYDAFEWQVNSSIFEFRHMVAAFVSKGMKVEPWYLGDDDRQGRYLAAHSLNIILGKWATLGVTETVLFTREQGLPDFQYINPISIYTVLNTNQEAQNGNLMLGFQWLIHPFTETVSIKGQLLLDDFQVDNEIATDKEPAHWGLDMGVYWRDPIRMPFRQLISAEYNFRSPWLYTVPDYNAWTHGERYTYLGKSLGFSDVDGDQLQLTYTVAGNEYWMGSLGFSFSRQGSKTPLSWWADTEIGGLPKGWQNTAFPTGIIERTIALPIEGSAYLKNFGTIHAGITPQWVKNRFNKETDTYEFIPRVSLELTAQYCNFFVNLPE